LNIDVFEIKILNLEDYVTKNVFQAIKM